MVRVEDKRQGNHSTEVEILQERIAELIVENDSLSAKLTNTTFDCNDVIGYLKETVEDKDAQLARLEDSIRLMRQDNSNAHQSEIERHKTAEESLQQEIEMVRTENRIMNTQLGNQHRMQLEMSEMMEKMNKMRLRMDEQDMELSRKALDESTVKVIAENRVREELNAQFEKTMQNLREEYDLQKDAALVINQKMIERLEIDVEEKKLALAKLMEEKELFQVKIDAVIAEKEIAQEENKKLRQMLEKSSMLTEKALGDSKRRLEESEKKRAKVLNQYTEIVNNFKNENAELKRQLLAANERVAEVEELMKKEKMLRHQTLRTHATQNARLSELKRFLQNVLDPMDNSNDDLLGFNMHAICAKLTLLVNQIPIVQ